MGDKTQNFFTTGKYPYKIQKPNQRLRTKLFENNAFPRPFPIFLPVAFHPFPLTFWPAVTVHFIMIFIHLIYIRNYSEQEMSISRIISNIVHLYWDSKEDWYV